MKEQLVHKVMKLAAQQSWETLSLQDIAAHTEVSLADLHEHFDDKTDILVTLGRMIDKKVLKNAIAPSPDEPPRDLLFDILMERFETLNEHRNGMISVLKSFRFDPKQAVISLPYLCRSMTWMLEGAGIETTGLRGALKVAGLTGLYIKVLKTWAEDESPDLAKTMAELDKSLGRAESIVNTLGM